MGSHSRPQLIGALGKEVQDKFLIVFHFHCTDSVADICSWVLRYVGQTVSLHANVVVSLYIYLYYCLHDIIKNEMFLLCFNVEKNFDDES